MVSAYCNSKMSIYLVYMVLRPFTFVAMCTQVYGMQDKTSLLLDIICLEPGMSYPSLLYKVYTFYFSRVR